MEIHLQSTGTKTNRPKQYNTGHEKTKTNYSHLIFLESSQKHSVREKKIALPQLVLATEYQPTEELNQKHIFTPA